MFLHAYFIFVTILTTYLVPSLFFSHFPPPAFLVLHFLVSHFQRPRLMTFYYNAGKVCLSYSSGAFCVARSRTPTTAFGTLKPWVLWSVYTIQQTSSNSRVFWIHLLEFCWTFAGSCKHPIRSVRPHLVPTSPYGQPKGVSCRVTEWTHFITE